MYSEVFGRSYPYINFHMKARYGCFTKNEELEQHRCYCQNKNKKKALLKVILMKWIQKRSKGIKAYLMEWLQHAGYKGQMKFLLVSSIMHAHAFHDGEYEQAMLLRLFLFLKVLVSYTHIQCFFKHEHRDIAHLMNRKA